MIEEKDTLCVSCAKACNGGCSWSASLRPVSGWTAQQTNRGWMVTECPSFVRDNKHRSRPDSFDYNGVMKMLEAMLRQMRDDYIWGRGQFKTRTENRQIIEKFLMSDGGRKMLQLSDPEEVIKQLRTLARRHDSELVR